MKLRTFQDAKGGRGSEFILVRNEQKIWFNQCISMVLCDTRWVLDNLDYLPTFAVNWENYHHSRKPFIKKPEDL